MYICLPICLSVRLSLFRSLSLSVCLSVFLPSLSHPLCLSVCLCLCLRLSLSLSLFFSPPPPPPFSRSPSAPPRPPFMSHPNRRQIPRGHTTCVPEWCKMPADCRLCVYSKSCKLGLLVQPSSLSFGWFVGCLTSQQHPSVSQGRICSDNCTCCHTEIEASDHTQSQYTDTGPTSPSADPITSGAWQGSYWGTNF